MLQLKPLDENVPIFRQINTYASPAILVNIFHVAGADIPALSHYPSSAVASPHLFARLTVPNLCVGP